MYIMITDKIYLNVFLYSLTVGMLMIYLMGEDRRIVYVYPNMTSYQDILFKDHSNQCYQYKPTTTQCPTDQSRIQQIPIGS